MQYTVLPIIHANEEAKILDNLKTQVFQISDVIIPW
jgi:hypothetical protein